MHSLTDKATFERLALDNFLWQNSSARWTYCSMSENPQSCRECVWTFSLEQDQSWYMSRQAHAHQNVEGYTWKSVPPHVLYSYTFMSFLWKSALYSLCYLHKGTWKLHEALALRTYINGKYMKISLFFFKYCFFYICMYYFSVYLYPENILDHTGNRSPPWLGTIWISWKNICSI